MPVCPKGHTSVAADYCDECGTPLDPSRAPAPPAPAPSVPAPAEEAARATPCPECGAPADGRFCEVCGHDFLASPTPQATAVRPETATPVVPAAVARWRVVVTADRAYHERMQAAADADAESVTFPAYCPERRFELTGDEVLIGRRSRSRGIEPAVDLTGPPEDAAVSHMHALLVRTPAGTWTVVDLGSANGTFVNEETDPIAANQPVPMADGDRIHVGAWTTLTLRAG
jgi:hypothetical protein